jgi:protein-disulfide isomerase
MNASQPNQDGWKFSTFLLVGVIVGYGFSQIVSGTGTGVAVVAANNPSVAGYEDTAPPTPTYVEVSADDDAFLGSADAPITVVEFSDYQCPFCQKFYLNSLPGIMDEYINAGKVKLVYRDYPLDFHPNAFAAAEAAECAGEQEQYFDMHDALFNNMSGWSGSPDANALFKEYASNIGLERASFDACLDNHAMADEINIDFEDAIAAGVSGTPTFFINGQKIVGAQPASVFSGIFDSILAQ